MPDAPGMPSMPSTLGLSFAEAISQAAQSGAPVIFGSSNVGSGTAGGASSTNSASANPRGDATSVLPMTSATLPYGGGGGIEGTGNLLDGSLDALNAYASQGMGLNGGQVQSPQARLATYGPLLEKAAAEQVGVQSSFMPGPIAMAAIGIAVLGGAFLMFRG